ncbi:MAG: thioredoxin family protein [Candidatus Electronema sp. VV]
MNLRHAFLLAAAAVMLLSGKTAFALSANVWHSNASGYEEIYEGAKNEEKPFLLLFHVDWCGYCKRLKSDLLDNSKVRRVPRLLLPGEDQPGRRREGKAHRHEIRRERLSELPRGFPGRWQREGASVQKRPNLHTGEFIAELEEVLAGKK